MERFLYPLIPISAIAGAFAYIIVRTLAHARVRELEVKERIAMIERGLVPSPETDPRGFERVVYPDRTGTTSAHRHRRFGILLIGVGFGLMMVIGVAGHSPHEGIGVGGFLVIVGLAFIANSIFETAHTPSNSGNGDAGPSTTSPRASDTMPRS